MNRARLRSCAAALAVAITLAPTSASVADDSTPTTLMSAAHEPAEAHVGDAHNVTVTFDLEDPEDVVTGVVTVEENDQILGAADVYGRTVDVSLPTDMAVGTHAAEVAYLGDELHPAARIPVTIEVLGDEPVVEGPLTSGPAPAGPVVTAPIVTGIRASAARAKYGDDAVVEVEVDPRAGGAAKVTVAGRSRSAAVVGGRARVVIPRIDWVTQDVWVGYSGDLTFAPATTTTRLVVFGQGPTPTLSAKPLGRSKVLVTLKVEGRIDGRATIYRSIAEKDPLLATGVTTAGRAKFTVSLPKGSRSVYGEFKVPSLGTATTKTIKVVVD